MGTLLYARGRLPQPLLRRGEPHRAGSRRERPPRLRARGRRGARDELVRREPREARTPRPRGQDRGDQPARRRDRAQGRRRDRGRPRGPGPARDPHGAVGLDEPRRGPRASSRARSGRCSAAGVDGFCLETFGDLTEIHAAILACRAVAPHLPVVAQMTVDREGVGLYGTRPEDFGVRLDAWGADVIGVNCSVGPQVMLGVLERLRTVTKKPLAVQPNAGPPREVDGRTMFLCTPDYLEKSARRFLEVGASAPRRLLRHDAGPHPRAREGRAPRARGRRRRRPAAGPRAGRGPPRSRPRRPRPASSPRRSPARCALGRALVGDRAFPLLVELLPPKGCDVAARARRRRGCARSASRRSTCPTARGPPRR